MWSNIGRWNLEYECHDESVFLQQLATIRIFWHGHAANWENIYTMSDWIKVSKKYLYSRVFSSRQILKRFKAHHTKIFLPYPSLGGLSVFF